MNQSRRPGHAHLRAALGFAASLIAIARCGAGQPVDTAPHAAPANPPASATEPAAPAPGAQPERGAVLPGRAVVLPPSAPIEKPPASAPQKSASAAKVSARARESASLDELDSSGAGLAVLGGGGTVGGSGSGGLSGIGLGNIGNGGGRGAGAGAGTGAGAGAGAAKGAMAGGDSRRARGPHAEWPSLQGIPIPTTRKFLGPPLGAPGTLGDVAKMIAGALDQHGYEELGYFRYADGFAIATRPERIGDDGAPVADHRWPAARMHTGSAQSLQDLFEVNGAPGDRYRTFLFICMTASDVDFNGGAAQTWGLWKTGSANPEGDALLARPVGDHQLYAFVYELSQDGGGKVLVATASANTASEHLRGAGLAVFLR